MRFRANVTGDTWFFLLTIILLIFAIGIPIILFYYGMKCLFVEHNYPLGFTLLFIVFLWIFFDIKINMED